ncbi:saponin hydrolase precursor [Truncatella angustata]|uniref:Saponin hydrolase n=1 Tax=Truncatella angustata TaxID=152316 RepID=A0A9P8REG6_9PEZI|nr:saponin hydrolase precursor [Truncatella angustata]KAH6638596.1 saponin hydrolase precursor [Truncatella angustata]
MNIVAIGALYARAAIAAVPNPPTPEPIEVVELPLPPVTTGLCTADINPRGTGCIGLGLYGVGFQAGSFLPDGTHIVAFVTFTGAPEAPNPASIYDGEQIILIKTDGTLFPNGDSWKCVTCGIPTENTIGQTDTFDYPNAFQDGKRLLVGTNIVDCSGSLLTSTDCSPERTFIYPIRWNVTPDGSGASGAIRELRLHPDDVHLGFSSLSVFDDAVLQYGFFSRLQFNPSPTTGEPLAPRYDLVNVTMLYSPDNTPPFIVNGSQLSFHPLSNTVGELRGFSGRGTEVSYIGYSVESCNIDVFAADLTTGAVRRLTAHPEYVDPVDISADDQWTAVMDTRGSNRQMFMAAMRGVPPLIDMIATTVASTTRNNHQRRFFQPYLIDRYGDRGNYFGQKINAAGSGVPGSGAINDPEWNGRADPKWSPNGTQIVYWQDMTASPACGGVNPLPCYNSTEPGGRHVRFMLATLTNREPYSLPKVETVSDVVPWGTPYVPGSVALAPFLPTQAVRYSNYSDDGISFLNGYENFTRTNPSPSVELADWYSDLTQTGETHNTKKTSPGGFHLSIDTFTNILEANGTLTTTIDGTEYLQPTNDS